MHRREFVQASLAAGLIPRAGRASAARSYLEDAPDMLLTYLAGRLNALAARWDQERARIRTAADVEARNQFVRARFREMIHGLPERTPLAPVVVRSMPRSGYRVENVMFQSRPDFWVTGNLYIPAGRGPFPAVISPCGHYPLARMYPDYQFAYLNLVHAGFVVLAYDPIGQGERRQYWDPETGHAEINDPVDEHSMPGQVLLLMGEDLTQYRVWDGMRAIDYLLTRPEVDHARIGCAGHSGGGTLTLFISALDERVQCAVVNEGGTSHRWPLDIRPESRIGPSDVEQNLFPAALYGVDLCDLHVAIAPRPLLALIENYNPRFNAAAEHIRARYQQCGVPEKFATEEATDPHAWTWKLRQATTQWFSRWFYSHNGPDREPEFTPEPPEALYCTPDGSIRYSRQGQTIFSLLLKKQATLPPSPEKPAAPEILKKRIGYRESREPMAPRLLVTTPRKGYRIEKLEFVSEPGIYIPTWVFLPDNARGRLPATLFVNEAGKEAEAMEFGRYERLAREDRLVAAVDLRGMGATRPAHPPANNRTDPYRQLFDVEAAMCYMAWYMNQSLFGMRVGDIVRSVDYLLGRPDVASAGLRVVGQGAAAPLVLCAAVIDARIAEVAAEHCLLSWRTLAQVDRYTHSTGIFVRDVLLDFDLPQIAAALAPRPLTLAAVVDHLKHPVPASRVRTEYRAALEAYRRAGAPDRFRIVQAGAETDWVA